MSTHGSVRPSSELKAGGSLKHRQTSCSSLAMTDSPMDTRFTGPVNGQSPVSKMYCGMSSAVPLERDAGTQIDSLHGWSVGY